MQKILLIILLFTVFPACNGNNNSENGGRPDVIELTVWTSTNQHEIEFMNLCVEEWNFSHPKIRIKMQPLPEGKSSEEILMAAIAGKTTPDICANIWPGAMVEFVEMGGMVAVDKLTGFNEYIVDRVPENLLDGFKYSDGHIYQVPWKSNPIMVQYNVRMFREAGYEKFPETYSEYLDAASKITKDTDGNGEIDRWMGYRDIVPIWWQRFFDYYAFYIVASHGQTLLTPDKKINFENEASEQVFQFFQEIYKNGYFPRTTFQGDAFIAEKVATQFTGPWNIAHVERFKKPGLEYKYAPIPHPDTFDKDIYTYGDYKNIAIFSTSKYPEEAWEFVKFVISPQNDLKLLEICNQIPVRKNITQDPVFVDFFDKNRMYLLFADQALRTRDLDAIPEIKEILDAISMEYEECCIFGVKSPEKAVKDAAKRSRNILYQF